MKKNLLTSGVLLTGLFLAACAGGGTETSAPMDPKPLDTFVSKIAVSNTEETMDVAVTGAQLPTGTRAALEGFARTYVERGKGAVTMTVPAGSENAAIADETAATVRAMLKQFGVPDLALNAQVVDATGQVNPNIHLSFTSTKAEAAACGEFDDMRKSYHNVSSPNFGCASASNLAAMIADPSELQAPAAFAPASGHRAATAAAGYYAGTTTDAPSASTGGDSGATSQ